MFEEIMTVTRDDGNSLQTLPFHPCVGSTCLLLSPLAALCEQNRYDNRCAYLSVGVRGIIKAKTVILRFNRLRFWWKPAVSIRTKRNEFSAHLSDQFPYTYPMVFRRQHNLVNENVL